MVERKITSTDADRIEVRQLYQTAFPVEEQIPWDDLLWLVGRMDLDFTAYYSDDIFLGLTIVYPRRQFNWFWYFAVTPEMRGKGVGQRILTRLLDKYAGSAMILDMENPEQECDNTEQRRRRHAFYLRNGFRDTGVGRSFKGIDYTILLRGEGVFTMADYDEIINELRSFWATMPNADNDEK